MEESTQQFVALAIVVAVVALELVRRWRKKQAGKIGCEGCDTSSKQTENSAAAPVRFYKRQ
jgi:hypothetical protein